MAATPNYQATGTQIEGAGPVTVAWPAAHSLADTGLLVAVTPNREPTLSDPQNFQRMLSVGIGTPGAAGAVRLTAYRCPVTVVNGMGNPTFAADGNFLLARIGTIRNGHVADFWDRIATVFDTLPAPDTAVIIPGSTTRFPNCLVVELIGNGTDSAASQVTLGANADLGALTKRFDSNGSTGVGGGFALITGTKDVQGLFGTTTSTLAVASAQVRIALVIKPLGADEPATRSARHRILASES